MRSFAVLSLIAVLAGCSQVFQGNLFKSIDAPPPVSTSSMKKASVSDIKKQIADPSTSGAFYTQLKNNPDALDALQTNLTDKIASATTPADKVDAAQTLVLVTANGSSAGGVVNDAIQQAGNLKSGGSPTDAITALMAGKSLAEITTELTQFQNMQSAFLAMQTAATVGASGSETVDTTLFYGAASAATQGDLAQMALVTAAAAALISDNGNSIATLAARLFDTANVGLISNGPAMTMVNDALGTTKQNPTTNPYAYLSAATSVVPF